MPSVFSILRIRHGKHLLQLADISVPLVVGGLFYLLFRSDDLLMFIWLNKMGLDVILQEIREVMIPLRMLLPEWSIYSLPNALWVYSLLSFIHFVWRDNQNIVKLLFGGISISVLTLEFFQLVGIIQGTFSWTDVTWTLFAITLFSLNHLFILQR